MKKIGKVLEYNWAAAIILCALGVCLTAKSGLGVSMVVAPAYVIFRFTSQYVPWFTFGMCEYCFQGLLILIMATVMRRFKLKYLLSFVTCVLYGLALDMWRALFGTDIPAELTSRILLFAVGLVITSLSIALYLRTYLPQQGYELIVKEISDHYKLNVNKVKWTYDILSLTAAIVIMLLLFGRFSFDMVSIGTLICTVLNTPLIMLFGKLLDKFFEQTPISEKFKERADKILN